MMGSSRGGEEQYQPPQIDIQTHWVNPRQPLKNAVIAPFVKINRKVHDIHADFDARLDDKIKNIDREKALIFDVVGVIVTIEPEYIILFVPITKFWKVLIRRQLLKKSPFVAEGHKIELGNWMRVAAVKRTPPRDGLPDDGARYSHICYDSRDLQYFDVKASIPEWEDRFVNGVFQVKMVIPLTYSSVFSKIHDEKGTTYWIGDSGILQALVPNHRIATVRVGNWHDSTLVFWVNRGRVIGDYCIHLFEEEPIEEHKSDGTVVLHFSPFKYPEEFNSVQSNAKTMIVVPEMTQEEANRSEVDDDAPASYRSPSPEEIPTEFLVMAKEEQQSWQEENSPEIHDEFLFLDKEAPMDETEEKQIASLRQKALSNLFQFPLINSKPDNKDILKCLVDPEVQFLFPSFCPPMTVGSVLFDLLDPRVSEVIIAEGYEQELLEIATFIFAHYKHLSDNEPALTIVSEVYVPHE